MRQPTLYLPHGGGPCFFMEWTRGPKDLWDSMAAHLRGVSSLLPEKPKALLVVSAHWEEVVPTVMTHPKPSLYFDYSGFPAHTYQLTWPAPGAPDLARRIQVLLGAAGIDSAADAKRGFDHGVFIPLKLSFPDAEIPTLQLSLRDGLDASEHLAIGRALAPLRDEGVLIIGSGMSYHNMRGFFQPGGEADSQRFDAWLTAACEAPPLEREAKLADWERAPSAGQVHPRSEHLTPLFVVAGAAHGEKGRRAFTDSLQGLAVSGFSFGD